jgi:hypothetical protein
MKYLLFVFGTYDENHFVLEKVGEILGRIASGDVKYRLGPTGGIFSFESLNNSEQIDEIVYGYLSVFSAMYFITPLDEDVFYGIQDEEICKQLIGEIEEDDNLSDEQTMEHNLSDITEELKSMSNESKTMSDEELRNFIKRITDIEETLEKLKIPSLDDILDRINEYGIQNLTQLEKELLDEYAKG